MTAYRLFPTTSGPLGAASYSGNFIAGVAFEVTAGGCWLEGYYWWVPADGDIGAQKFALWQLGDSTHYALISAATVTSDTLTAGQWTYVPLAAPLQLSIGAVYVACTGWSAEHGFPVTDNQFGVGDSHSGGITSGPLTAFSAQSGTRPAPIGGMTQGVFSVSSTDPTVAPPEQGASATNFWMDVKVSDTFPAGYAGSFRLWPNQPVISATTNADNFEQTFGTEFTLSEACALDRIWFYSPPDVAPAALPTRCGIWEIASRSEVTGTDNNSPLWSGSAGSGWIACSYSGVTLPAGDYKVTVFASGGSTNFYQETEDYFGGGGPGADGISAGPLTAPGVAAAAPPGQSTYHHGAWAYPDTYDGPFNGQNRWVDVEVTPAAVSNTNSGAFLAFF
jgi:hypothetical protein